MSPLPKHERKKSLLGQFVRALARELQIPVMPMGSSTWKREDLDRGLEADESFYLGDLERLADPDLVDLAVDPPPDLAIEIEITQSALSRISIYAAYSVFPSRRFNDGQTLKEDGSARKARRNLIARGRSSKVWDEIELPDRGLCGILESRGDAAMRMPVVLTTRGLLREQIAKQGNRA